MKCKPSSSNTIVNSLSQLCEEGELQAMISSPNWLDASEMIQEALKDPTL